MFNRGGTLLSLLAGLLSVIASVAIGPVAWGRAKELRGAPATMGTESRAAGSIVYVDHDASGLNDGSSWEDAFQDLQDALDAAASSGGDVDEVWVAEGVYRPDRGTGDQTLSFQLLDNVGLYGGFAGTETSRDQRDPAVNETVLSGDLDGDDVDFTFMEENTHHVVNGVATSPSAVLDGFVIRGGNAALEPALPNSGGGGMVITFGSPTVVNCTFTRNRAWAGGGLVAFQDSYPTITGCRFVENLADQWGGGIDVTISGKPTIRNSVFLRNFAGSGGGLHIGIGCEPRVANGLFIGNSAEKFGGGIRSVGASPVLTGCTFSGNHAGTAGGAFYNQSVSPTTLSSCILWGNTPEEIAEYEVNTTTVRYSVVAGGWPGAGNSADDPLFVDADGPDDVIGTADDELHLLGGSPCINTGDPGFTPMFGETDLDGNARVRGCRVDMGGYESDVVPFAGDFNADEVINLADFGYFELCFSGPAPGPYWSGACLCTFDFDDDGSIGLHDYSTLFALWTP